MPVEYYKYICKEKNFTYLNGKNVLEPTVLQIIIDFIEKDKMKNLRLLQNNLAQYKNIFQYVYSNVYPEIYCTTEKRDFDLKSNFHILFKTYWDKTQMRWMGKNPINYETVRKETHVYEQKPVNIDDFNEEEQAEVKKRIEKQKKRWQELAENVKAIKQQKRDKETKVKEKQIWDRLAELNSDFKTIKKAKKEVKKMSETVINWCKYVL